MHHLPLGRSVPELALQAVFLVRESAPLAPLELADAVVGRALILAETSERRVVVQLGLGGAQVREELLDASRVGFLQRHRVHLRGHARPLRAAAALFPDALAHDFAVLSGDRGELAAVLGAKGLAVLNQTVELHQPLQLGADVVLQHQQQLHELLVQADDLGVLLLNARAHRHAPRDRVLLLGLGVAVVGVDASVLAVKRVVDRTLPEFGDARLQRLAGVGVGARREHERAAGVCLGAFHLQQANGVVVGFDQRLHFVVCNVEVAFAS
ncbi:MAG: hypothetical protein CL454_00510 [Acidimicrobiaceae bacterium]|nr:hypothetical protein [Acidimicrobiaceae bacterium]